VSPRRLFSGEEIIKALQRGGFEISRQSGSHVSMTLIREGSSALVVVIPMKPEIPKGTFVSILKMARLS